MRTLATALAVIVVLAAPTGTSRAHAHTTYNISGYGGGVGGSTNGADGLPTAVPPAAWTNGPVEGYTGGLPVNWYVGMHSTSQVRTVQTGVAPAPPAGSLLAQIASFNAANDPDLPADVVLAVGGKSWADPDNGGQGWGHGLDYGLIHFSPFDTLIAAGPLTFTVTLSDDPSDGVAPQLAFALYAGWDASPGSTRHQTFTTSPAPVDDPLGASGLALLDHAAATAPGQTLSRTYLIDPAHGGYYTVLVGAQGGVAGQYQLTITTAPDGALGQCQADLDAALENAGEPPALVQCRADLATATAAMTAASADADGDSRRDRDDVCPGTAAGAVVDSLGCSQTQFCAAIDVATKAGRATCERADWKNDEPLMKKKSRDCAFDRVARACRATP